MERKDELKGKEISIYRTKESFEQINDVFIRNKVSNDESCSVCLAFLSSMMSMMKVYGVSLESNYGILEVNLTKDRKEKCTDAIKP